jgi:hypothetical protein
VVVIVSGLAPLMLALVAHLQARLNADRLAAVKAAEVAVAVADSEPAPGTLTVTAADILPVSEPAAPATETPTAEPTAEPTIVRQLPRQRAVSQRAKNVAKAARFLAAHPGWNAKDLAPKLGVSERTAERYMADIASGATSLLTVAK